MGVKIWAVTQGPIAVEELPEDGLYPEDSNYFLICKVEVEGKIGEDIFWFESLDDAYEWTKHFSRSIEPLEVEF